MKVIVRSLELGDVIWVAKRKDEEELVLEHVLERKRADDLVASIKDGRFKEQKVDLLKLAIIFFPASCGVSPYLTVFSWIQDFFFFFC